MNENLARLVPILSNSFKIAPELVRPEARLSEDLKADSLDASVALMDIEEAFGIIVPERERTYRTVGDILQHIEELLQARQPDPGAHSAKAAMRPAEIHCK
jgi:acyl carrier protein